MSLGKEMASALRVDWSPSRAQAAEAGLRRRRERRARTRAAAVGVLAFVALAWVMWPRLEPEQTRMVAWYPPAMKRPVVRYSRSWSAPPIDPIAPIEPIEIVELAPGKRQFETTNHALRVEVGKTTTIAAQSAKFAAARYEGRVDIEVFRGEVMVASDGSERKLLAGEHASFVLPPAHAQPASHAKAPQATAPQATAQAKAPQAVAMQTWTELARDGHFDEAYAVLGDAPVRDVADELLLAADVKRLSHHPAEAVAPLQKVVRDHGGDPRAPLAAFTLGRVLLEELARPAEAATAFARADSLAPTGPLAEDAVAREVEALSRAHDPRAHEVAEQYVARFPQGRKLRSVRRLGGL